MVCLYAVTADGNKGLRLGGEADSLEDYRRYSVVKLLSRGKMKTGGLSDFSIVSPPSHCIF